MISSIPFVSFKSNNSINFIISFTTGDVFLLSSSVIRLVRFVLGIPSPLSFKTFTSKPSSPDSSSRISSSSASSNIDLSFISIISINSDLKYSCSITSLGINDPSKDFSLEVSSICISSPYSFFVFFCA